MLISALKLKHLTAVTSLVVLLVIASAFFSFTNPGKLPSVGLIIGFVLIGAIFYVALRVLLQITGLYSKCSAVQRKAIIWTGTALPVVLLALQSIGQLTSRDVITIVTLFLAGCFYIIRLAPKV